MVDLELLDFEKKSSPMLAWLVTIKISRAASAVNDRKKRDMPLTDLQLPCLDFDMLSYTMAN